VSDASTRPRVRLIGLPTDSHSSFERGAAGAPARIRHALESDRGNAAAECGLELGADIDVDLDAFDPAFAPGVSHPEPGGPSVREFLQVLDRVPGAIVGADIVELDPNRDLGGITAILAAKLVKELAALSAKEAR
jgi:arginase family enzyme